MDNELLIEFSKLAVFGLILIINRQAVFIIAAQIIALMATYEVAHLSAMAMESNLSEESKLLFTLQCTMLSSSALCVIYAWLSTSKRIADNIKYVALFIVSIAALDSFMAWLAVSGEIIYTNSLLYKNWQVIMHSIDALIAYLLIYNQRGYALYLLNNFYSRISLRLSAGTLFAGCMLYRLKNINHKHHGQKGTHAQ